MAAKKKNFEESMAELEQIVKKLERGELSLDESLVVFKRGVQLSKELNNMIDEVEKKITLLVEDNNGTIREEIFKNPEESDEF